MKITDIAKHQRAMIEFMKAHGIDEEDAKELMRQMGMMDKLKKNDQP